MKSKIDAVTLDQSARLITMASMLYYSLDEAMMSDSEFDERCHQCAEGWKLLSPIRRWQLGSPEAIRTSGFHVKVTTMGEGAVVQWLEREGKYRITRLHRRATWLNSTSALRSFSARASRRPIISGRHRPAG